jgi:hypothetical protein
MNQGIFAFPNINDPNLIDIKEFDVSGSYSIPDGTKLIQVIVIGAGGGGGSGRRGVGSFAAYGGGAGGAASIIIHNYLIEQLDGKVLEIAIGAGGGGGAPRTTDSTGQAGSGGGATTLTLSGKVGFLLYAPGGAGGGAGGGLFPATNGAGRTPMFNGFISTFVATVGPNINTSISSFFDKGGAQGGLANNSGTSANPGRNIVICNTNYALGETLRTGNSANSAQSTDLDGTGIFIFGKYTGGIGGAGGGGGSSQNATNGGNGWRGGGGGGGGGSVGFNSGGGGVGGNGYVAIFCYK